MSRGADHFQALVNELKALVERERPVGGNRSVQAAQRREELERELINLLRSDNFSGPEARRSIRVNCRLGARLRTSTERLQVTVTNLSCGGAAITWEQALSPGVEAGVEIELEILVGPGTRGEFICRFGRISWVHESSAGIEFELGTDPQDQRMLRFVLDLMG